MINDKLLEDVGALIGNEFSIQKIGVARAISEYQREYTTCAFIANLTPPSPEMEVPHHLDCVRKAFVAYVAEWIAIEKRRYPGACAIIWRKQLELETNRLDAGHTDLAKWRFEQLRLRFRAHVLTKEEFEAGPIKGWDEDPVTQLPIDFGPPKLA